MSYPTFIEMMNIHFRATDVEITPSTGFIGFADRETEHYFWMQPEELPDGFSSDKAGIWIERDDQGFGGAGGNWSIELTRNSFRIQMQDMPWVKCDSIAITFDINDAKFVAVTSLICKVMMDCSCDLTVR